MFLPLYGCLFVRLTVCQQNCGKMDKRIFKKFPELVSYDVMNKLLIMWVVMFNPLYTGILSPCFQDNPC